MKIVKTLSRKKLVDVVRLCHADRACAVHGFAIYLDLDTLWT